MSLKTFRRCVSAFMLLVALGLCTLLRPWTWEGLVLSPRKTSPFAGRPQSEAITYLINGDKWTRFSMPPSPASVRVLFNALTMETVFEETKTYQVSWRWLDNKSTILKKGVHIFSINHRFFQDDQGTVLPQFVLEGSTLKPADTRRLDLYPSALANPPAHIEWKLDEVDPAVPSVVIRVAVNAQTAHEDPRVVWRKLRPDERRQVRADNARKTLSPEELTNWVGKRHRPLGPVGVVGRDYVAKRLYALVDPGRPILPPAQNVEHPPDYRSIRVWAASPDQPLIWRISQNSEPTPFRLELRSKWHGQALLQLIDGSGSVNYEHRWNLDGNSSFCDYLDHPDQAAGRRFRSFLHLPPTTVEIRLLSDVPVTTAAWLRPAKTPSIVHHKGQTVDRLPLWFPLMPVESGFVHQLYFDLTEDWETEGEMAVTEHQPEGEWLARQVLTPRQIAEGEELDSLATVFRTIPLNRSFTYRPQHEDRFNALVMFQKPHRRPTRLSIELDGEILMEETLTARGGELMLDQLDAEPQRLRFQSDDPDLKLWINHVRPETQFLRRKLAVRLDQEPLFFKVHNTGEGALSLNVRLLRMVGGSETQVFRARILGRNSGVGPFENMTPEVHELRLDPAVRGWSVIPTEAHQSFAESMPWRIHLGDDVPRGTYTLMLERITGPMAFAMVTQVHKTPSQVSVAQLGEVR